MVIPSVSHQLLIFSQDFEQYLRLIRDAHLEGLSILATDDEEDALRIAPQCDLLFGEPSRVSLLIDHIPGLLWVQSAWAGVEPLLSPSLPRGYILTNARNVYGPMMSEYIFGYLLAVERQIVPRWQSQQMGRWDPTTPGRLRGKLLGLLGVGSIGAHLASTASHFGMQVYGYTRRSETSIEVHRYFHGPDWVSFCRDLDYLVCTLPGTDQTRNLVNAEFLAELPPRAWLLNVGRGSTLDENALINALRSGTLAGAVLDVFREEPLPERHPLWSTPNTYITSHTAARNYLPDIAGLFVSNYKRLIAGVPLLYQVDFELGY